MPNTELVIKLKTALNQSELQSQVKQMQDAFNKVDFKSVSSNLRASLSQIASGLRGFDLKKSFAGLNEVGKEFSSLPSKLSPLKTTLTEISAKIKQTFNFSSVDKEIDGTVTKFKRMGTTMQIAVGSAIGNLATQGVGMVVQKVKDVAQAGVEYQAALADLSAITGVSGDALKKFGENAKKLSEDFGTSAVDQISTFKGILSRLGPDLAQSEEGLNKITIAINTMAKASGLDATTAMDALTTAMLQFGVDMSKPEEAAETANKMLNVMAAGAKEGAAEIPQISNALVVAGVAAKSANLSFEETNAALQTLAKGGKYGSEAGTALRNVLGYLQKATGPAADELQKMGLSSEELGRLLTEQGLGAAMKRLGEGMQTLGTDAEKNAAMMTIFGQENAASAAILMENVGEMGELQTKITGTNTGFEQAATNMDTFATKLEQLKAKLGNAGLGLFESLEGPLMGVFTTLSETLMPAIKPLIDAIAPVLLSLVTTVGNGLAQLLPNITGIFTSIMPLLTPIINLIGSLAPLISALLVAITPIINVIVAALAPVIGDIVLLLQTVFAALTPILPILGKLISIALGALLTPLVAMLRLVINIIIPVVQMFELWFGVIAAILTPVLDLIQYVTKLVFSLFQMPFDWLNSGFKTLSGYIKDAIKWVQGLVAGIIDAVEGALQFLGLMDKETKEKKISVKTEGVEQTKKEIDNLTLFMDLNSNSIDNNTKIKSVNKKATEDLLASYRKLQDTMNYIAEYQTLINEKNRLMQGRASNIYDEAAAYDLQRNKINSLNAELQKYIDKYKIELDDKGQVIKFGVKLDDKAKADITKEIENINLELLKSNNAKIDLEAKILANDKEFLEALKQLENKELDFKIKIGTADERQLLSNFTSELNLLEQNLNDVTTKMGVFTARKGDLTNEEKAQLKDLQDKYIVYSNKRIDLQNNIYDAQQKLNEKTKTETLKNLNELNKIQDVTANKTLEVYKRIANYQKEVIGSNLETAERRRLDALQQQYDNELITQENYEKQKLEISEYYNELKRLQEEAHLAQLEEMQRQHELQLAADKKKSLEEQYVEAVIQNNRDLQDELSKRIDEINKELEEKGNFWKTYGTKLGEAIGQSFASMFDGREDDLKKPWRTFFAVTAGALKAQLEVLIADLAMKELQKLSFFSSGLGAAIALPIVVGTLRGLLGGLLSPVLASIASFSTGGRVDSPTLAIVGDASYSRPGRDTEWILRDDQLLWVIQKAVSNWETQRADDMRLVVKDLTLNEFKRLSEVARQKDEMLFSQRVNLEPLVRFNPTPPPSLNTKKIEKLLEKIYDELEAKEFNLELDGVKVNKQINRVRNRSRL